jgi:hypothetical protein
VREPTAFGWRKVLGQDDEDRQSGNILLRLFSGDPERAKQLFESVPDAMFEVAAHYPDYPQFGLGGLDLPEEEMPRLEVMLTFEMFDDEVIAVRIHPAEERPTGEYLRRFPWSQWTRAAEALWRLNTDASGWSVLSSDLHTPVEAKETRRGYPDELWAAVADAYREAAAKGSRAPTATVAELWGIKRNTAAAWVRKCRQLGLLPEARPGRAS